MEDLEEAVQCVLNNLGVCLNPDQLGALASFVSNVGCKPSGAWGGFRASDLRRRLDAGESPGAVAS